MLILQQKKAMCFFLFVFFKFLFISFCTSLNASMIHRVYENIFCYLGLECLRGSCFDDTQIYIGISAL